MTDAPHDIQSMAHNTAAGAILGLSYDDLHARWPDASISTLRGIYDALTDLARSHVGIADAVLEEARRRDEVAQIENVVLTQEELDESFGFYEQEELDFDGEPDFGYIGRDWDDVVEDYK